MSTVRIEFMDGTSATVKAFRTVTENGVLRIRTSHDTSYRNDWECFPLVNVKRWWIE